MCFKTMNLVVRRCQQNRQEAIHLQSLNLFMIENFYAHFELCRDLFAVFARCVGVQKLAAYCPILWSIPYH